LFEKEKVMATTRRPSRQPATPPPATAPARQQRADARRNVESILDAAVRCLAVDPDASVGDIAAAAGVGRVTLYGHFKTRADLIDAVLDRTVAHADATLETLDTTGDPRQALTRLVAATWQIVHQFRGVHHAAQRELPPERIRGSHDRIMRRVQSLIERGQRAGTFRDDLPKKWLVTTAISLMHAAAEESSAGRLAANDATQIIAATMLAALTPPGRTVPTVNA
jgi:AcrR family transcriptional regulator